MARPHPAPSARVQRSLTAVTLTVVLIGAALAGVAVPSGASAAPVVRPRAGATTASPPTLVGATEWARVEDDFFVPARLLADHPVAAAAGRSGPTSGYTTWPTIVGNLGAFTIRLVDGPGAEALRGYVEQAAAEVTFATGGDYEVAAGTVAPREPRVGEILVQVTDVSPCDNQPWAGCGSVIDLGGVDPATYATSGMVWLNPDVLGYTAAQKQHVASHELGHALGLRHYDAAYQGQLQVMNSADYDATTYRPGDFKGLQFLYEGRPRTAPANDDLSDARVLASEPAPVAGTTFGATIEPFEPLHAGQHSRSVWFRWTPGRSGIAAFDTDGSDFDTLLAAYQGTTYGTLSVLAENDDADDGTRASAVRFHVRAGVTYVVAVDGVDGGGGSFELAGGLSGPPPGDDFGAPLTMAGLPASISATTDGATRQSGEPRHAGDPGGASVWITWTPSVTTAVVAEITSASFDTVLGVYRGSSLTGLTTVGSNDDVMLDAGISSVRFTATAGQTYRFAVDGHDAESGRFDLRVRPWTVSPFTSEVAFVQQQFEDFVGAPPTLVQLMAAVADLQSGAMTGPDLVAGLAHYPDRLEAVGRVSRLYLAYFDRVPDADGLSYWIGRYRAGTRLDSISAYFARSDEFADVYGRLDDSAFVRLVYRNVLDRQPDAGGLAFWVDRLDEQSRGWLMLQFSESTENKAATASEVDVVSYRLAMLSVLPNQALFSSLVRELDAGTPLQTLIARVLSSEAYRARI